MKSESRLDFILKLKFDISQSLIFNADLRPSKLVFGAGQKSAELIVRQFLVSRLLELSFNKEILYCFGDPQRKFSYPLPHNWLQIVSQSGVRVNFLTSSIKFKWYIIKCFLRGSAIFGMYLMTCLKELLKPSYAGIKNYVYFDGLVSSNIPKANSKPSYDIISWYLQWLQKENNILYILHRATSSHELDIHGITIRSVNTTIPPLANIYLVLLYFGWFIQGGLFSLIELLRNHWWHPLMMMEAVKARAVKLLDSSHLAKDYLFHNSGWIYRPLWTYEAEKKGSKITFYFYSRNCENFKSPHGYPIQANFWHITNWSRYLVWNESHEEFIYRCVSKEANVLNVGNIWFQDNSEIDVKIPNNTVAVFPVQPMRESFYQSLGAEMEYYVSMTANQFLNDAYQAIHQSCGIMALKNKRDIGRLLTHSYSNVLNNLLSKKDVLNLDSGISAYRVIQQSKAVISMPFTSTALIARELGKPTCYYDPFGLIQKDDRASSDIEIVTGKRDLERWLSNLDFTQPFS